MLHKGKWGRDRILSRRYVREAHTPTETNPGYGYLLWTNARDKLITPIDPGREVIEGPKPMIRSVPKGTSTPSMATADRTSTSSRASLW